MLSTRDTIISTLQKDNLDHERLEKVLRNQKQILANKNADLRSGDVPNTVKNRIVENTLRGKHLYMTSRIFHVQKLKLKQNYKKFDTSIFHASVRSVMLLCVV